MNKTKFFIDKVSEACSTMKINMPLIRKDNRLGKYYIASVHVIAIGKPKVCRYLIRYNHNMLQDMPKADILHAVLHELGHIKTCGKTREIEEYKAEKFAIKAIKKHYPKYYNYAINYLRGASKTKVKCLYARVFKKILKEEKK